VHGDVILAVCMTEPHAGTDVANYRTNADIVGDKLVLNGVKTLISRVDEAQASSCSAASTSAGPRRHRLRDDRARHAGLRVHGALPHDGRREPRGDPFENCELPLET
jgi:alkylation response protein AidB-like acyl-CoA dehydrogenase